MAQRGQAAVGAVAVSWSVGLLHGDLGEMEAADDGSQAVISVCSYEL